MALNAGVRTEAHWKSLDEVFALFGRQAHGQSLAYDNDDLVGRQWFESVGFCDGRGDHLVMLYFRHQSAS